ncbi:MAG: TauD/TfdA family dioxygenase [Novosphingobium sp.]|nr:TauD/TfdA family dioxygenase [Novosphingobium sp.]
MSANITIDRITGSIGAVIGGVDLCNPLPGETVETLHQGILDHGVIFFRDQDITMEQYWRFMENFGQPHKEESTGTDDDGPEDVQTGDLSFTRYATAVWHADTTSLAQPPIATALRAVEVPPFGGDTCWLNTTAAWDALDEPMKKMLDGLTAVHSIQDTVERMAEYAGAFFEGYSSRNEFEQVHPVVLTHPETGRKSLYVSECFTTRIVELDKLASQAVLGYLFKHTQRPDFSMRWKWAQNDMCIWDNRSTQHFAVPDYESSRQMQRVVIAGVKPGEYSELKPVSKARAA